MTTYQYKSKGWLNIEPKDGRFFVFEPITKEQVGECGTYERAIDFCCQELGVVMLGIEAKSSKAETDPEKR